jgi:hypothetical protein
MGVTVEPQVKHDWRSNDGINSYHPFTECMSLTRYEQIKRFIHITDLIAPTVTPRKIAISKVHSRKRGPVKLTGFWSIGSPVRKVFERLAPTRRLMKP